MLQPLNALKAIFFDMDNVLVFSERKHFEAWQQVVAQLGIDPEEIHFHDMIGVCDLVIAQQLKKKYSLSMSPSFLWQQKVTVFLKMLHTGLGSPSGRNIFLQKISTQFTVGIVSSAKREEIFQIIKQENIEQYFHFVIGADDCEKHKPDPLPYQQALIKAGVQPHEALVVEDSVPGISAAKMASIPVIGILKDQHPDEILNDILYFHDYDEVDVWLQNTLSSSVVN